MKIDRLISELQGVISGERAKRVVEEIARYHRIPASSGFDAALASVRSMLEKAGLEVDVHEYPADGKTSYCGWTTPMGWDLSSGELWQTKPHLTCLGRSEEDPMIVSPRSPSGTFEGRVVHVESGGNPESYAGLDVDGCFVLTCGSAMKVAQQAAKHGAVGVVLYPDDQRALASQHLRVHDQLRPAEGDLESLIPAFSLSRWGKDQLLEAMANEEVTLRGTVEGTFTGNPLRVLETVIMGSDENAGETLLIAHLCHPFPSANDNASGSGLLVELARQLHRHSEEWGLVNTVRCLWVPEFIGSLAWANDHAEVLSRTVCTVNLDMVGQCPETIGEPLRIYRMPSAIPTFFNACIEPIMARIVEQSREMAPQMVKGTATRRVSIPQGSPRPLHWIFDSPASGSDHLTFMAAPHGIPSYMVAHEDPYWHTTLDTVEKVDAGRLKQVGIFALTMALLPSSVSSDAQRMTEWTLRYAHQQIGEIKEMAIDLSADLQARLVRAALVVETNRIDSLVSFLEQTGGAIPDAEEIRRRLVDFYGADYGEQPAEDRVWSRPRRVGCGPLSSWFMEGLASDDVRFLEETLSSDGRPMSEFLLQACDGVRDAEQIAHLLSLDLRRVVTPEDVERGLALLAAAGTIEFLDGNLAF